MSYCYSGPICQLELFFMTRCPKKLALACPIGNIGVSACLMAAFNGFYECHEPPPLGDVRGIVPPHRNGHRNGQQSGYILHHHCVDCCPDGRLGDTERVVTRWWHLVAFMKALIMLYCIGAPPRPPKWATAKVHSFAATAFFDCCNCS
jgi:hypothetical protein